MLLRSITKHMKEQNWFAVALDFVIVVVGILIAFQITSWNEARVDRQREAKVLQEIAADLRADINEYAVTMESSLTKIAAINYVLKKTNNSAHGNLTDGAEILGRSYADLIEESTLLSKINFAERAAGVSARLWSAVVLVSNAQPSTTAFASLVSSGELSILRNAQIVRLLQEYSLITDALQKAQDVTFRPARNQAIEVGHSLGLSSFSSVNEQKFLDLVASNVELSATIQTQSGWAKSHFVILAAADLQARKLLNKIEQVAGAEPLSSTRQSD